MRSFHEGLLWVGQGLRRWPARQNLPLAAALVLLGVLLAVLLWPRGPAANHITRAAVLQYASQDYTLPSRTADPDALPGQWRDVALPYQPLPAWLAGSDRLVPDAERLTTTWFRFRAPPPEALDRPLYIYIPYWKTDGQITIYVDGRLSYQSHANTQWNGSNMPLWVPLEETVEARTPREVLIRMQHVTGTGGNLSSVWLGSYSDLVGMYLVRLFLTVILPIITSIAYLTTGVFTLCIWLGGRREPTYLLFFPLSVATTIRGMHHYLGADRLPVSDELFGWLTAQSALWSLALLHLFLGQVHKQPRPRVTATVTAAVLVFGLATLPGMSLVDPTLSQPVIYLGILLTGLLIIVAGFRHSLAAKSRDGLWLTVAGILALTFGVHDWLMQNNLINIEGIYLNFYSFAAVNVGLLAFMLRRYMDALSASEQASRTLELKIAQREAELERSYARLREIEQRDLLNRERQRMMQDMHDGMGSSLVTALRAVEHGKLDEEEIVQLLRDCIDDLKLTIDSLEPVETDLLLLVATLRFRLQPRLESTGIKLVWQVEEVPPLDWLDQRNSLHILRILQEAFTNIIKHARATTIVMTTRAEGDRVSITLVDNGVGFDVAAARHTGKGLSNQMRRAEAIGAEVFWASAPSGSRFQLDLPIRRPARPQPPAA